MVFAFCSVYAERILISAGLHIFLLFVHSRGIKVFELEFMSLRVCVCVCDFFVFKIFHSHSSALAFVSFCLYNTLHSYYVFHIKQLVIILFSIVFQMLYENPVKFLILKGNKQQISSCFCVSVCVFCT